MNENLITPLDWANIELQLAHLANEMGWLDQYKEHMIHYKRYMAVHELIEKLKNE